MTYSIYERGNEKVEVFNGRIIKHFIAGREVPHIDNDEDDYQPDTLLEKTEAELLDLGFQLTSQTT